MTLRERVALLSCPRHGTRCRAAGLRDNRRVTFLCGLDFHVDAPALRAQLAAPETRSEP